MKKIVLSSLVLSGLVPMLAFAVPYGTPATNTSGVSGILGIIAGLMNIILPLLIAFAAIYFVWNVIVYTISGDDKKKGDARKGIIQGLIGLLIIVSFWGIVALIQNSLDLEGGAGQDVVPCIPMPGETEC
jgi:hypothetical protein